MNKRGGMLQLLMLVQIVHVAFVLNVSFWFEYRSARDLRMVAMIVTVPVLASIVFAAWKGFGATGAHLVLAEAFMGLTVLAAWCKFNIPRKHSWGAKRIVRRLMLCWLMGFSLALTSDFFSSSNWPTLFVDFLTGVTTSYMAILAIQSKDWAIGLVFIAFVFVGFHSGLSLILFLFTKPT